MKNRIIMGKMIFTFDKNGNLKSTDNIDNPRNKALKDENTQKVLASMGDFIERGRKVTKARFQDDWAQMVNRLTSNYDNLWYYGVTIAASLDCMEKISSGMELDNAYKVIGFNDDGALKYFDMELSGNQKSIVSKIVSIYHERGDEFEEYVSSSVNNKQTKSLIKI